MQNDKLLANSIPESCPISNRRADANIQRGISFQVALFTMILFFTQESFFAFLLFFDFTVRTLRLLKLSPFYLLSQFVLSVLGVAPKLHDESPKRFALYLGLVTSLALVLLLVADFTTSAMAVALILLVCALLEALFDFCIGCKIYYGLQLLKGVFSHARNLK